MTPGPPVCTFAPVRARIALTCGVAALGLGLAVPASPAGAGEAMSGCEHKPHVDGFRFDRLMQRGLGCEHAKHLAAHVVRHGTPEHYECSIHLVIPHTLRTVRFHCAHKDNHHGAPVRAFAGQYYVY